MSTLLDALKRVNQDTTDVEDLIVLAVSGEQVLKGFDDYSVPAPEWLSEGLKRVKRTITEKRRDYLEQALTNAKLRRESLATAEEKRTKADEEIARLSKILAG